MFNNQYSAKEKKHILLLANKYGNSYIAHRYHVSVRSIQLWRKKYDGSIQSLENGSHKPHSIHPNSSSKDEIQMIREYALQHPQMGLNEIYGVLSREYAYSRHPVTLWRILTKLGYYDRFQKEHKPYKPKPYDTPTKIGEKFQIDVKVVPKACKSFRVPFDKNFYQYTIIDECTRERFIYAYDEQSARSTIDFVKRAIMYFGYKPKMIQSDNGQEFTYLSLTDKTHPFDEFCKSQGIIHKRIKPRTPRHNGKVERSHRNDMLRFYRFLTFDSLEDLNNKMRLYLERSNSIPSSVLKSYRISDGHVVWLSPKQKRFELLNSYC